MEQREAQGHNRIKLADSQNIHSNGLHVFLKHTYTDRQPANNQTLMCFSSLADFMNDITPSTPCEAHALFSSLPSHHSSGLTPPRSH